jgi:hypothetical protein
VAVFSVINAAAAGNNTIVAAQGAGVKIRVVGFFLLNTTALIATFQSGAGGAAITGPLALQTGQYINSGFSTQGWFETAANALLNLNLSAATQVSGAISWVQVT